MIVRIKQWFLNHNINLLMEKMYENGGTQQDFDTLKRMETYKNFGAL